MCVRWVYRSYLFATANHSLFWMLLLLDKWSDFMYNKYPNGNLVARGLISVLLLRIHEEYKRLLSMIWSTHLFYYLHINICILFFAFSRISFPLHFHFSPTSPHVVYHVYNYRNCLIGSHKNWTDVETFQQVKQY